MLKPLKPTTVFVRAHTESVDTRQRRPKRGKPATAKTGLDSKWPEVALVIDCETTIDERQALTIAAYRYCRLVDDVYTCVEEALIYADDLAGDSTSISILESYRRSHPAETPKGFPREIKLMSRSEFIRGVFLACGAVRQGNGGSFQSSIRPYAPRVGLPQSPKGK